MSLDPILNNKQTKRTVKSCKVKWLSHFISQRRGGRKPFSWLALLRSGLRFEWRSCHLPWSQKSPVSHFFKGSSIEGWRALKNQLHWILTWNSLEWDKYLKNSCLDAQERCVLKNSIFLNLSDVKSHLLCLLKVDYFRPHPVPYWVRISRREAQESAFKAVLQVVHLSRKVWKTLP